MSDQNSNIDWKNSEILACWPTKKQGSKPSVIGRIKVDKIPEGVDEVAVIGYRNDTVKFPNSPVYSFYVLPDQERKGDGNSTNTGTSAPQTQNEDDVPF
jgi:hypothetical protein